MMLQRTHDMGAVNAVYRHPGVWPWVSNDETPAAWMPTMDPHGKEWLLVIKAEMVLGVMRLDTPGTFGQEDWAELHVAFLRDGRGRVALEALRALWDHAAARGLKTVYGLVPDDNRPCGRLAGLAGMRRLCTVPRAFLRNGAMHDLWVYTKEVS